MDSLVSLEGLRFIMGLSARLVWEYESKSVSMSVPGLCICSMTPERLSSSAADCAWMYDQIISLKQIWKTLMIWKVSCINIFWADKSYKCSRVTTRSSVSKGWAKNVDMRFRLPVLEECMLPLTDLLFLLFARAEASKGPTAGPWKLLIDLTLSANYVWLSVKGTQ